MKREALGGGRNPVLYHQTVPSFSMPEWAVAAGYDGVILDLQHGELGLEAACGILRSIPRDNAYAYARVGSPDPAPVLRLLDSGARGIVAPTVESRSQTEALVAATKYPPTGNRSLGPSRPALYPGDSYTEAGNRAVSAVAQIETRAGVEHAEEIVATPGLDSVYIGPADLAVSHGLPGRGDWDEGPVREAISHIREVTRAHGVTLGIYSGRPEYAAGLFADGLVDYVGLGIDLVLLNRVFGDTIAGLGPARSARSTT
ncbi:HpcH/HpaI aldolase family protein [Streptomyces albogriseolus]|uniref:2-keto-3-deoxy-L-rhamnonate aldolase RhmA n=1 Tax=Streptomyces albogriseolus TaxID=1887 RepID=A0ACC6UW91_STRAO|nr:aldolase/citrate lyase family protein [Streptomyces viridodiastaticus]MCX4570803.1 aldolase/citrate lyase family protein [Streptomyces viridodiastaticus]